ncbi:MAG: methyltransferase domain-containing protein [Cyanobacteria bacterium J06638_20]
MPPTLNQRIQQFYDRSSNLWEEIWGEHMHHGYYGPDGAEKKERRQAQIDLIEAVLQWAEITQAQDILDVGCGIGGSSLYLAERYGAIATGITLSPVQANRASERAQEAGIAASFQVSDALQMPFADGSFDFVWSMESGEHMPDKEQFLRECVRVLKPGGKLLMVTWCHRPATSETPLTAAENQLLEKIYDIYCLPYVISLPEYEAIAQTLPVQNIRTADWSTAVAPFWDEVIDSAITPAAILGLLRSGWTTIRGAFAIRLMQQGYRQGLIRFGLLTAQKL